MQRKLNNNKYFKNLMESHDKLYKIYQEVKAVINNSMKISINEMIKYMI